MLIKKVCFPFESRHMMLLCYIYIYIYIADEVACLFCALHPCISAGGRGQRRGAGDAVETAWPHHRRPLPLQRPAQQPRAVHRRPEKLGWVTSK